MTDDPRHPKPVPTLVSELWELVRCYATQQTVEPIKGVGRFVAFGMAGSLVLGLGTVLLVIALLRVLQNETGGAFDGNWSWVPYALTLLACGAVIGAALSATRRRGSRS